MDVFGGGGVERLFAEWGRLWGVPGLGGGVDFSFSSRMRRRLGSCNAGRRRIALNAVLAMPENREIAVEILCHEAAHLAAHDLHGRKAKPHGPEWKALMRAAAFEPHVRFEPGRVKGLSEARRRGYSYLHVCLDCARSFTSARTDRRWRCRSCHTSTGGGRFRVTRSGRSARQ